MAEALGKLSSQELDAIKSPHPPSPPPLCPLVLSRGSACGCFTWEEYPFPGSFAVFFLFVFYGSMKIVGGGAGGGGM